MTDWTTDGNSFSEPIANFVMTSLKRFNLNDIINAAVQCRGSTWLASDFHLQVFSPHLTERNVFCTQLNGKNFRASQLFIVLWGQAVEMFHLWKTMTRSLPSLFVGASCRNVSPVEAKF